MGSRGSVLVLLAILLPAAAVAQAPRAFDVAAVKPHAVGAACGESSTYSGGRLVLSCFTLFQMVSEALDLKPGQSGELTGGPAWVRTQLWDVVAKADGVSGELPPLVYRAMLLSLVEREFQFKFSSRKREVKGFALVTDGKSKTEPGLVENSGAPRRFDLKPGISLTAQRVSMKELAAWLKMPMAVGERVEDRTGLRGEYDFVLRWTPTSFPTAADTPARSDAPTIFTALREQLGLRLRPARVLADVYTIDSVQWPQE